MEQFLHRDNGSLLGNLASVMGRSVADADDEPCLVEHSVAGGLLERRLVEQRADVFLVREVQRCVRFECPAYDEL